MSSIIKPSRSGGVIGTIGPIGGSGVFSLQERHALSVDNYDDVSLYLKMNGASGSTTFYDSSQYGHTVTANGNAQISTAVSKFGGASAAFDGTGDYIVGASTSGQLGSGDFTVECWTYLTARINDRPGIFGNYASFGAGKISLFAGHGLFSPTKYTVYMDGSTPSIASTTDVLYNQWVYIAVVRSGSTVTLYVNGVSKGTATETATLNGDGVMYVGASGDNTTKGMQGYIDDLRITKGVARYTGNFTPPQREFLP